MKKTLSLFLAVMISAAALAGCTENGNNGTETGTQQTTEDQTTEIGKDTTGDTTVEYNHTPDLPRNVYSVYEENVRHTIDEEVLEMGTTLPDATYDNLPKWYGFNLTNKFSGRNYSFVEEDFKTISEMGYNYVRLPMDYQMWIYKGNWEHINNTVMKDIDKAVEYGIKYNIHVDINFHRAPGFTVASPAERTSLWTDEETQQVFAAHWRMFALRYKDIPSSVLSFNLVNEPAGVSSSEYARIMGIAIDAIREVDPDRLIIADGLGGNKPVPELVPYKVAQSVHSYQPHSITHYMSTWSAEATMYPEPEWPLTYSVVSYLYGNGKSQWQTPLVIEGNFDEGEISITVGQVSSYINLIIKADDKVIMNETITCIEDDELAFKIIKNGSIYQNMYDIDLKAKLPAGTEKIEIIAPAGDWMTFTKVDIKQNGKEAITINAIDQEWGKVASSIVVNKDGTIYNTDENGNPIIRTGADIMVEILQKWKDFRDEYNVDFFCGEFGVYNKVPHDITLAFIEDKLKAFEILDCGWALWNFTGTFGIADSGREDVTYEQIGAYKFDTKLRDLLMSYLPANKNK